MKSNFLIFSTFIFFLTLFSACENDEDTKPIGIELEMKAVSQIASMRKATLEDNIVFTEVLLGVTELEFEEAMNDDSEIEYEGNYIVDLLNGTSTPDFGFSDLLPGIYSELEVELEPILSDGNSVKIVFEYTKDGEEPVTIEYTDDDEIEFEIESDYDFEVDEDAISKVLILFDLDVLLAGVDFSSAKVDADGIIRINDNSNEALKDILEDNFEAAFESGEDNDDDDDFDDDDDD